MPGSARIAHALTLLIVGGGLALRWLYLDAHSLWYDEGYTAWITGCSAKQIVRTLSCDPLPPLHFLLLRWWRLVFGDGDIALRSFSALCSTAALGVFWTLARRTLGRPWAVMWAMALMCFSTMQIEYAREARYPVLLSLLGVLMLDGMDRHLRARSRRAAAWGFAQFVLASAAALYTHTIAAFYLVAIQAAWLLWPRNKDEGGRMKDEGSKDEVGRMKDEEGVNSGSSFILHPSSFSSASSFILHPLLSLLLADALILLLYAPWLPFLAQQLRWMRETGFWDTTPNLLRLVWTIAVLAGVKGWYPGRWVTTLRGGAWEYSSEIAAGAVVLIILIVLTLVLWQGRREHRRMAIALAVFALLPVIALFLQSLLRQPSFVERTLIMSSPALCLLLAIPLFGVRWHSLAQFALLAILLACSISSVFGYLREEQKEDWRGVARYITALPDERRLLVFLGNEGQLPFDHYAARALRHPYDLTGAPRGFLDLDPPQTMRRVLSDTDIEPLKTRLQTGHYREVILILRNDGWYDPRNRVRSCLDANYQLAQETPFHRVTLRQYIAR